MVKTKQVTYGELSAKLDGLLAELQQPDCDVDQAAELYEAALKTITAMEEHLESAKNRIKKVQTDFGGKV